MTIQLNFEPVTPRAADAIDRFARVVDDFVGALGNLGALAVIDVEGVGRAAFTAGWSSLDRKRPVQAGDVFPIGSQSKTAVALLLVLLAREGLVRLDDPVLKYLDLPIDSRITVRHLLMNSSGLGEYTGGIFNERVDTDVLYAPRDLVALALPQGQLFTPGERFDYCNTGWVIAAMVIEAICGSSLAAAAAQRVTGPLGLKQCGFGGLVPEGELMRGYLSLPGAQAPVDMTTCCSWGFGAGDGLASADDVLALYKSLLRPASPLGISLADLTAEVLAPSTNPVFALSLGTQYGLGLERRAWAGREVWGHPGSTGGARSGTWLDPERGVAVTSCVTVNVGADNIGEEIRYPRAQLFAMALETGYALAQIG